MRDSSETSTFPGACDDDAPTDPNELDPFVVGADPEVEEISDVHTIPTLEPADSTGRDTSIDRGVDRESRHNIEAAIGEIKDALQKTDRPKLGGIDSRITDNQHYDGIERVFDEDPDELVDAEDLLFDDKTIVADSPSHQQTKKRTDK